MSVRERWIVYPLIFFALGAAIRDKLLQRVETKEIVCESIQVVDLQNPYYTLVELGFDRTLADDPNGISGEVGFLRVIDSEGNVVCRITDDSFLQRMVSRQVQVVDPHNHPLVNILAEAVAVPGTLEEGTEATVSHQGVVEVNNERWGAGVRLAVPPEK